MRPARHSARITAPTPSRVASRWSAASLALLIACLGACTSKGGDPSAITDAATAITDATTATIDARTPTTAITDATTAMLDARAAMAGATAPVRDAMTPVPDAMTPVVDAAVDAGATAACENASLKWRTANKTTYTSYPDPGSEECVKYNGCTWAGQFSACRSKQTEKWVAEHDIVAAFPDFATLKLHDLCLRARGKTIVVTVYDTCADSDCAGCCTENRGKAEQLIDIEHYTDARWGVGDGPIEWADLGPTKTGGCD
jgi:hypothetical protein